jgi:cystathionine beta-lyase
VAAIYHPALPGAPDHALWKRDFRGTASLFSFALKPAPEAATAAFLDALRLFGLGFSWGGFESLAIWADPQLKARRVQRDYGGALIRLHVGLESVEDLIADLRQALDAYAKVAA